MTNRLSSRLMAFLLTLVLLIGTWLPAQAATVVWEVLINVHWVDGYGQQQQVSAAPIVGNGEMAYWATLPAELLGSTLTVEILCSDPGCTFWFDNGTMQQQWITDAAYADPSQGHYITYAAADGSMGRFPLYFSSMSPSDPLDKLSDNQSGWGYASADDVNLRSSPSTKADSLGKMDRYHLVPVYASINAGGDTWYQVNQNGVVGFIHGDYFRALSNNRLEEYIGSTEFRRGDNDGWNAGGSGNVDIITPPPADDTPDDRPTENDPPAWQPNGYAVIPVYYYLVDNTLLDMQEITLEAGTHTVRPDSRATAGLYPVGSEAARVTVYADGSADVASITFWYEGAAAPDPDVKPDSSMDITMSGYGYVTASSVNVRTGPSTRDDIIRSLKHYAHCQVLGSEESGGDTWYLIAYGNDVGYVHGDYLHLLTVAENEEYMASSHYEAGVRNNATEAPAAPTPDDDPWSGWVEPDDDPTEPPYIPPVVEEITPPPAADPDLSGYGYVTASSVNVRPGPSTKDDAVGKFPRYALCQVLGSEWRDGDTWYYVNREGVTGYVHGDYLKLLTYEELSDFMRTDEYLNANPTPTPEAAARALVPVYYYHVDNTLLHFEERELAPGSHQVRPDNSAVQGMRLVSSDAMTVNVYADGSADVASVIFWYEDIEAIPVEAEVTVLYQLGDGTVLDTQVQFLSEGEHTVFPGSTQVGGYTLEGPAQQVVRVDAQGQATPAQVVFTYHTTAAQVTVHYQDDRGFDVAAPQVLSLTDGVHVVRANPEGLASGWELAPGSAAPQEVLVQNGVASVADVYFFYQQIPTTVVVTVHYYDTMGNEIATPTTLELPEGSYDITPVATDLPAGSELVSESTIAVRVYANGTVSPQEISFYYRTAPLEAEITVYYQDEEGRDVATAQHISRANGTHIITPSPADLPAGYELIPGMATEVQVTVSNGVANRQQVVFYYQYVEEEPTLFTIPVYYYDTMGNIIATTQYVQVASGPYTITANPTDLPEGYELMMEDTLFVAVLGDGSTDPEEVAFYYRAPERKAVVTVSICDTEGRLIASPYTVELAGGRNHTVSLDATRVPAGYDASSAEDVTVYVSRDGVASPAEVAFYLEKLVVETPTPVGDPVYRYAKVTSGRVAFRTEPSTSGGNRTIIQRFSKNDKVYVLKELYGQDGTIWAMLNVDGTIGYMSSEYIDIMSRQESDDYAASRGATPVPTFTPTPSPEPPAVETPELLGPTTPGVVEVITPPPTVPVITPTPSPVVTATPVPYNGYALTTRATALRTGISSSDISIIQNMQANELVIVSSQLYDPITGESWSIVTTLRGQYGFMPTSALRYITNSEAQPYLDWWAQQNATAQPTQLVTPTAEPMQVRGYGITVGDNVPFRQMANEYSRIIDNLSRDEVVRIEGQTWVNGVCWHSVVLDGQWGYIRSDLVRLMTLAEEDAYLNNFANPQPTMATTNRPYNPEGLSSYGYVNTSSVNFREGPSTHDRKIAELKRYAFCLVMGSEYVNGETWYHISYGGNEGYLHGDYFHQMSITELNDFLGSEEYRQGIANNAESGEDPDDDVGFTGTGGLVSAEDQTINNWQNNGNLPSISYAPFNPIATVPPIQATHTPLPGIGTMTEQPTATPSPTPTFNPLPDVTYPVNNETGSGGSGLVWVLVVALLAIAGGGAFIFVQYQQKKRRIAMRAAQRRAQAARSQQTRTYGSQPRSGSYPSPYGGGQEQPTSTYQPYGQPRQGSPYSRPTPAPTADDGWETENDWSTQSPPPPQPQRGGRRSNPGVPVDDDF